MFTFVNAVMPHDHTQNSFGLCQLICNPQYEHVHAFSASVWWIISGALGEAQLVLYSIWNINSGQVIRPLDTRFDLWAPVNHITRQRLKWDIKYEVLKLEYKMRNYLKHVKIICQCSKYLFQVFFIFSIILKSWQFVV